MHKMNKKFVLRLLSSPVIFASMMSLVMTGRAAHASQTIIPTNTHLACVLAPHSATPRQVCIQVSNTTPYTAQAQSSASKVPANQIKELAFTDQESDEALKLFGCDCPRCINALRQLHGMAQLPV
jgi:hypothetical protein